MVVGSTAIVQIPCDCQSSLLLSKYIAGSLAIVRYRGVLQSCAFT